MKHIFDLIIEAIKIVKTYRNFYLFLIYRSFNVRDKTITAILWNGIKFKVRLNRYSTDKIIIQEVWKNNTYKIFPRDFHGNTTIDVGAHLGVFSIFAATLSQNETIYSFEPDSENFNLLQENIKINNLQNKIFPIKLAVLNEGEQKIFKISKKSSARHSFFSNEFFGNQKNSETVVSSINLIEFFKERKIVSCDVLKLDCEGAEFEIILNLPKDILSKIGKIVLEYHDKITKFSHQDLLEFLQKNNFNVNIEKSKLSSQLGCLYAIQKK